ncbi:MAG: FHA domain-containing protein [Actinomycetes bacterium]
MPEQLLTILKLCLLALLYLFFLRVLRAVWTEVNPPKLPAADGAAPPVAAPTSAPRMPKAPKVPNTRKKAPAVPTVLVATAPPGRAGSQWSLAQELVAGRHAGCNVVLDEQYVSQQHAKFFVRSGAAFVEDLGSTNGTWVNGERATGQRPVRPGDQVQIGNVVLEVR